MKRRFRADHWDFAREAEAHGAIIRNICHKHNITELVGDSLAGR